MFTSQVRLQSRYWRRACAVFGLLIATAGNGVAQIVPQSIEIRDPTPPPMQGQLILDPVPGLTSRTRAAPLATAMPLGITVQFEFLRSLAPIQVRWVGDGLIVQTSLESNTAAITLDRTGWHAVSVEVNDGSGWSLAARCLLRGVDIACGDIAWSITDVSVTPVDLDENSSNHETMAVYFGESVAQLKQLGPAHYRTSIFRAVHLQAATTPSGFEPLTEWQFDGRPRVGTEQLDLAVNDVGSWMVAAGPVGQDDTIQLDTYRVRITSHTSSRNIVPEGEPITFEAVTEPSGYEDEITWISSTLYGTASPVLGRGPTFIVQFDATWGRHRSGFGWQWLGVRADNARFNQDQKGDDQESGCKQPCLEALFTSCGCDGPSYCGGGNQFGDPVYLFSGERYERVVDLQIPGRGIDFVWGRKYRSRIGPNTAMGNGWDYSYNISIVQLGEDLVLLDGDTRQDTYERQRDGTWTAPEFFRVFTQNEGGSDTLTFPDTSTWEFHEFDDGPQAGKIRRIVDRNGNTISFDYDEQGRLVTVHDSLDTEDHNRDVTITYNRAGFIQSVTDWTGRQVRYEYYGDNERGGSFGDL